MNSAYSNKISLSTMTSSVGQAMQLFNSSSNTITQSYLNTGDEFGALLSNANYNAISQSTITDRLGLFNYALYLLQSSSNTITGVFAYNSAGIAVYIQNASYGNTVSQSTMTGTGGSQYGLLLNAASSNTVTGSYIYNSAGTAADLDGLSNSNTISRSTITSGGASYFGLLLGAASSNTITQSWIANTSGKAAYLDTGASSNTISLSTITSGSGFAALYLNFAGSTTITQSYISSPGHGAYLNGANNNTISGSTFTTSGAPNFAALTLSQASSNTVTGSVFNNSGSGDGAEFLTNSNYNTMSLSTVTSSGGIAFELVGSATNTIVGSYVLGQNGLWVEGSTGTVIGGSTFVGVSAYGLELMNGSVNLKLSSSTVIGNGVAAVQLAAGNSGLLVVSTNTIEGLFAAGQTAGTQLWITSNTIMPYVLTGGNAYGVNLLNLTAGATIENNAVVYRSPLNLSGFTGYGLYASGSKGLVIDHNRFDDPGMITAGSHVAVEFTGTTNSTFTFNDVYSTGTSLTNAYLLEAVNTATGLTVRNNIFSSSFSVSGASATIVVDAMSEPPFSADYNDYFSSNSLLGFQFGASAPQGLVAWKAATSGDAHSLSSNPLYLDPSAGIEDFHPKSTVGRFLPGGGGPVADGVQSPTIDAGDPAAGAGSEPAPNGGRANQGSYGLTAEASETAPFIYPGCAAAYGVGSGQTYASIAAAVAAMPASLPAGKSCVVIEDSSVYTEQVLVQNFTMNLSSIAIFAGVGFTPTVNSIGQSAAFVIANASVSIAGINVAPTGATAYGLFVSSAYVSISSVNVIDPAGHISNAGIALSSWTTVSSASVTVGGASATGFLLPGSTMTSVSYSSAAATGSSGYALWLDTARRPTRSRFSWRATRRASGRSWTPTPTTT